MIASSIPGDEFGVLENPHDFDKENHARLVALTSGDSTVIEWWGNSDVTVAHSHFVVSLLAQQGVEIPEEYKKKFRETFTLIEMKPTRIEISDDDA